MFRFAAFRPDRLPEDRWTWQVALVSLVPNEFQSLFGPLGKRCAMFTHLSLRLLPSFPATGPATPGLRLLPLLQDRRDLSGEMRLAALGVESQRARPLD